jgi:translation initiation factor 1
MSRPDPNRRKVDVARPAAPLQSNPFAVLGELDALKNLPAPAAEPVKPEAAEKDGGSFDFAQDRRRPPLQKTKTPKKALGRLILRRETKDRGGKVVVVVYGFAELPGANAVMIADLARRLKGRLGCGGSFDRQEIVLQGDRAADVCAALEAEGYRVDGVKS